MFNQSGRFLFPLGTPVVKLLSHRWGSGPGPWVWKRVSDLRKVSHEHSIPPHYGIELLVCFYSQQHIHCVTVVKRYYVLRA